MADYAELGRTPAAGPPRMFYFGPWAQAGHGFNGPNGSGVDRDTTHTLPWGPKDSYAIDGGLLPRGSHGPEGLAALARKDGWTAISFCDRTVDSRPGSHSTYIAEGNFTFDEMVLMAKARFADRWNRMKFEVVQVFPA